MGKAVDRLVATGLWLHGQEWVNPLARDLSVSPNTLRKWLSGKRPYPEIHYDDRLVDLIDLHRHRGDILRLSFFHDENVVTLGLAKNLRQL